MQPLHLKKNTRTFDSSFSSRHIIVKHIYDIWHYHEEIELNYVVRGYGTRFIGDNIQPFEDGDIVLVGSNLPHVWKNSEKFYDTNSNLDTESIVIQFLPEFLGENFMELPELNIIKDLIVNAKRGILIKGRTKSELQKRIFNLLKLSEPFKFLELLQILAIIAYRKEDTSPLASPGFINYYENIHHERINEVFKYIVENFKDKIILAEAADLINMNESAFCRYFKSTTKKTFIEFVNDIRIGYACKLLIEGNLNATQVCYECGFQSLSYFNRLFKSLTGVTPKKYRNSYHS